MFSTTRHDNAYQNQVRNLAILFLRETYMGISDDECLLSIKKLGINRQEEDAIEQILLQNKISKNKGHNEKWEAIWNGLFIEPKTYSDN